MPELSTGAQIAIMLIVLSVVISVVFTILGFTRSATAEGLTGVQNSLDAMMLSQHDDYDQKSLSGAQVISALKLQNGKPWAAIIVNKKPNSAVVDTVTKTPFNADGFDVDAWKGYNYGALLKCADNTDTSTAPVVTFKVQATEQACVDGAETNICRTTTTSWYTADLKLSADGSLIFNNNIVNCSRSGKGEYVRPTAKYMARIVKDSTGTIAGACFIQIA